MLSLMGQRQAPNRLQIKSSSSSIGKALSFILPIDDDDLHVDVKGWNGLECSL